MTFQKYIAKFEVSTSIEIEVLVLWL